MTEAEQLPTEQGKTDVDYDSLSINSEGLHTPHGPMHIIGSNEQTGAVILANSEGSVETTAEELGEWLMDSKAYEKNHTEVVETAENVGRIAVDEVVEHSSGINVDLKSPPEIRKSSISDDENPEADLERIREEVSPREVETPDDAESLSGAGYGDRGGDGDEPPAPPDGEDDIGDPDPDDDTHRYSDDLEVQARINHLRYETVLMARDKGYSNPIEFLVKSRRVPETAKRLELLGYDLTPPPDKIVIAHEHPIKKQIKKGQDRRDEWAEYIDRIEDERDIDELTKLLKRPSDVPFKLHNIPLIGAGLRKIKLKKLARSLYKHERSQRDPSGSYNDGLLGKGTKSIRELQDYLESLDREVSARRSKLSRMNIHELRGELMAPRRHLAQLISRDLRALSALERLESVPDEHYEHADFKAEMREYNDSVNIKKIEKDRTDFIQLRILGTRDEAQEERFQQILNEHPSWN